MAVDFDTLWFRKAILRIYTNHAKCDTTNSREKIATLQLHLQRLIDHDEGGRSAKTKKYTAERKSLRTEYRAYKRDLLMEQSAISSPVRSEDDVEYLDAFVGATNSMASLTAGKEVRSRTYSVLGVPDRVTLPYHPCPRGLTGELQNFRDWMARRAKEGDSAATCQLRSLLLGRMPEVSISIVPPQLTIESPNPTERKASSPFLTAIGKVRYRVHLGSGNVRYGFAGKLLFIDEGNRIAVYEENEIAYATALKLGHYSFGNRLHVTGTEDSLLAMVRMAAKHHLPVQFTDKKMNKLLREVSQGIRRGTLTDGSAVQAACLGAAQAVRSSTTASKSIKQ